LEFDRAAFSVVKCPICNYKGSVADFKENKKQPETPVMEETVDNLSDNKLYKPGKLEFLESDVQWLQKEKTVDLQCGKNTIGRMVSGSTTTVQLPVADPFMGRTHAVIDVITKANGIFEHRLSDNGSKNGTFHNGERLEEGDVIKLMPNDTIKLGHTLFKWIAE